ncbi:hypothetical protein QFZ56_001584 [Streptomyces achromogenes]|uniref:Uncharacterized protein n=1 Tax=Streptomyces achromogenes TaxID=67255 RepID=A0ABU0PWW3_STRAH|nr:hypothetical protein [Streptomyces achromogenes]
MRTDSLLHPGRCPLRADGSAPGSAPAAPARRFRTWLRPGGSGPTVPHLAPPRRLRPDGSAPGSAPTAPPRRLRPGGGLRVFTPSIDPAPPSCRRLPSPGPSASPCARPAAHRDRPAARASTTCPAPRPSGTPRLDHLPHPSPVLPPALARPAACAPTTPVRPTPARNSPPRSAPQASPRGRRASTALPRGVLRPARLSCPARPAGFRWPVQESAARACRSILRTDRPDQGFHGSRADGRRPCPHPAPLPAHKKFLSESLTLPQAPRTLCQQALS